MMLLILPIWIHAQITLKQYLNELWTLNFLADEGIATKLLHEIRWWKLSFFKTGKESLFS